MTHRLTTLCAVGVTLLAACERIVEIELPTAPPRLVIDARIEHVKGTTGSVQQVLLTTTDAVFNNRLPPPARGAQVQVTGAGQTFTFPESSRSPGLYQATFLPTLGQPYTLSVVYDGERYESIDTVRRVPPIDTLYFEYEPANLFVGDGGFRATITLTDPPGEPNFYLWELYFDGVFQIVPDVGNQFNLIATDEVTDGSVVAGFQPGHPRVEPGQTVLVRQLGISSEAYDYMFALFQQSANGEGSPFSVPPADIRGNVANLTNPGHFPLGYFFTVEVAEILEQLPADATPPS